ncbi:monocarboxylate transporter 9 [Cimex lectularius]|uniref:Major facilitator superfamily (MFS) profile domain-containing protein n=1 Tax=Cimex lectularius TaxID=79782 RepID=A0A8I6RS26_CIMLE|nr:monocarboxylate transporter 9 [Cimex lectularius]
MKIMQSNFQYSMGGAPRTSSALAKPPDGGWGWFVVFGSFMIHVFADGVTYSFGVFFKALVEDFKEGQGRTSWIASILVGVTLCSGPLSSALVNRWNCRVVTIAGAIVASAGLVISMFAQNVFTLWITVGLITGLGLGLIYLPAIVCVTCYFEKYRSLATGIAVCGSGLGTFILSPIVEVLVKNFGWRTSLLIIGLMMLICIFFGMLFRPLPPDETPPPEQEMLQMENGKVVQNGERTMPNGQKRPHSIHGATMAMNVSTGLNGNEKARLALSQPMLTFEHRKSAFGSGIMYRKDILYSGSTTNIPQHHKSATYINDGKHASEEEKLLVMNGIRRKSVLQEENSNVICGCIPCAEETTDTLNEMLDFSLFKDPLFIIFTVSNFLTSIGFNVPYVYIVYMSVHRGVSDTNASYLLSVIGLANTIGRIALGYISDKPWVNRLYVYNTCLAVCGIGTAACILCENYISFAVYAFVFGFTSGAYVGLTSVVLVDLLGLDKLTNAFGLLLLFQGLASLVGPPITGGLYDWTNSYTPGFVFSGMMIMFSGLMLFMIPSLRRYVEKKESQKAANGNVVRS